MSIEQETRWITGDEFARERRRLIEAGVPEDAPEFQALWTRVRERDEHLFKQFGRPYLESHRGRWIAIGLDGRVVIRDTAGELVHAAVEAFGPGNAATRKLADFPGYDVWAGGRSIAPGGDRAAASSARWVRG